MLSLSDLRELDPLALAVQLITSPAGFLGEPDFLGEPNLQSELAPWTLLPAVVLREHGGPFRTLGDLIFLEIEAKEMAPLVAVVADMAASRFVAGTAALYWASRSAFDEESVLLEGIAMLRAAVEYSRRQMRAAYSEAASYCEYRIEDREGDSFDESEEAYKIIGRTIDYLRHRMADLRPRRGGSSGPLLPDNDPAFEVWFDLPPA
jgi:hypothetical protein